MAGKRKRRPRKEIDGKTMFSATVAVNKIRPVINPQYLRRLARNNQIPGHLEGIQWFFDPSAVVEALNKRESVGGLPKYSLAVVSSNSAIKPNKPTKKELLNDPLAGF